MVPDGWIGHRRPDDRELLGWIHPSGDAFVAVDRLGRARTGPVDWLVAEQTLDDLGLGYLAGRWTLTHPDGRTEVVRLVEVGPDGVVVKQDDGNNIEAQVVTWNLPFPAPRSLRPGDGS